jgi:hypothetical protein
VKDVLAGVVEDTQGHGAGVQVDAAIESVLLVVVALGMVSFGMDPGAWKAHLSPTTWGQPRHLGIEPAYAWDRPRPTPSDNESIKTLQQTGGAVGGSRVKPTQPRQLLSVAFGAGGSKCTIRTLFGCWSPAF